MKTKELKTFSELKKDKDLYPIIGKICDDNWDIVWEFLQKDSSGGKIHLPITLRRFTLDQRDIEVVLSEDDTILVGNMYMEAKKDPECYGMYKGEEELFNLLKF